MNRRSLFKGALAVIGASFLPRAKAEPASYNMRFTTGPAPESTVRIRYIPPSLGDYKRAYELYGNRAIYGNDLSVPNKHYYIGYSNKYPHTRTTIFDPSGELIGEYFPWNVRKQHMYAGEQRFYGESFEEALTYAETYKRWLESYDPVGLWMTRPRMAARHYARYVEMKGSFADLTFSNYSVQF